VNEKFATFADSMYAAEKQARKEVEERNKVQETIKMALAAKKEREIREAATLVRAEKAGMVASSISKFNSELRKEGSESEIDSRRDSEYTGKKRSREERELEEAKKERDALRHQRKREIERDRRMEVAGKKNSKSLRDEERDISEKIALG
jgi:SNW domain-containing protein 1